MTPAVYAVLPRTGLGNKILVWARARVFAEMNGLPLYVSGWARFKPGPILRNERTKRWYWGCFKSDSEPGLFLSLRFRFFCRKVLDPSLEKLPAVPAENTVFIFTKTPDRRDYFEGLRPYRALLRKEFRSAIADEFVEKAEAGIPPVIGVHVRRGDFSDLAAGENPGETCNRRLPQEYYSEVVKILRRSAGRDLPATLFSDGRPEELRDLLALPSVSMSDNEDDIVDLVALSRSGCIVVTAGSTFSYWAAFISEAPVVTHPGHHVEIRPDLAGKVFEGPVYGVNFNETLLKENLERI